LGRTIFANFAICKFLQCGRYRDILRLSKFIRRWRGLKLRLRGVVAWGFLRAVRGLHYSAIRGGLEAVIFAVRAVAKFYAANAG